MGEDRTPSQPPIPLELEPGEERIASWNGYAGLRAVVLVLTDRRLVTLRVRGVSNKSYALSSSLRLEEMRVPRTHDAYGGRKLEIEGSDLSFSRASEDAVLEEIVRARNLRIAKA